MSAMQNAFSAVACILLMAGVGAAIYAVGILRDEHLPLLSTLVVRVALPCMIANNLLGQYTRESLLESVPALAAALLSILLTMAPALALGRLLRLPRKAHGRVCGDVLLLQQRVHRRARVQGAVWGRRAPLYASVLHRQHVPVLGLGYPI